MALIASAALLITLLALKRHELASMHGLMAAIRYKEGSPRGALFIGAGWSLSSCFAAFCQSAAYRASGREGNLTGSGRWRSVWASSSLPRK